MCIEYLVQTQRFSFHLSHTALVPSSQSHWEYQQKQYEPIRLVVAGKKIGCCRAIQTEDQAVSLYYIVTFEILASS